MPWVNIGNEQEFSDSVSRIIEPKKNLRIGVFKSNGGYYAYEDICVHQGGPACEGDLYPNAEGESASLANENSGDTSGSGTRHKTNFACPWHGVEYNIRTGICRANKRLRLRSFKVVAKNGALKILI